jgi:hypothetical protein
MKKILGILLAVCFFMSVTAAAVSADAAPAMKPGQPITPIIKHNDPVKYKIVWKWVFIKAHVEFKKVKIFIGFNKFTHKPMFKTITKAVRVPGKWVKIPVKVPVKPHFPIRN